jgi:hypothetical protein
LIGIVDDTFAFVKDADQVKKIIMQKKILVVMAQQTTDCAYFIRDYATKGFCALASALISQLAHRFYF